MSRARGAPAPVDLEVSLAPVIAQARLSEKTEAVCTRAGERWQLELWGSLPPSWAGSLALHCAGVGIDIVEGSGCRIEAARWAARFVLSPGRGHATPGRGDAELHAFDFLRMARRRPSGAMHAALPRLESFEIVRLPGSGGFEVSVRGFDEPGFLAGVLERFALFGLHADRFIVGSEGELAADWFVLRTTGGRMPSPDSVAALRSALTACLSSSGRARAATRAGS